MRADSGQTPLLGRQASLSASLGGGTETNSRHKRSSTLTPPCARKPRNPQTPRTAMSSNQQQETNREEFHTDPLISGALAVFAKRNGIEAPEATPPQNTLETAAMNSMQTVTSSTASPPPPQNSFTTSASAGTMARGWDKFSTSTQDKAAILRKLDERRIRPENPPERPESVLLLNAEEISTAANLTVITAQAKAGKTAMVTGVLGALLAEQKGIFKAGPGNQCDCLGFSASPHEGRAVIVFDTEQSSYAAFRTVERSWRRANQEALPKNFRCYSLQDLHPAERRAALHAELQRGVEECGGVHAVILDGVADLVMDPNDLPEASAFIAELMRLAKDYSCPMILVLHENPSGTGQSYAKGRGHLGSELERKAESNLRVEKDAKGISTIWGDRCRSANLPKALGLRFQWDDEKKMHVTLPGSAKDSRDAEKKQEAEEAVREVFEGLTVPVKWGKLKKAIADTLGVAAKTAEGKLKAWDELGVIVKETGGYVLKEPAALKEPSNQPS